MSRPQVGLSISQTIGGALAAMAAAALGTRLGISGTVLGAALASVSAAVLGTILTHSIRRTGTGVRAAIGLPTREPDDTGPAVTGSDDHDRQPELARRRAPHPGRMVYAAVLVGVIGVMLVVGGVLGLHLAEQLTPYADVADLRRYLHRVLGWAAQRVT